MKSVQHPGEILKTRFLDVLEITPYQLAKSIGVHVSRVSKLIKGERALTPDTATRLGLYFGVPADWWMDMQAKFELDDAERLEHLRSVVVPLRRPENVAIGPNGVRVFRSRQSLASRRRSVAVSDGLLALLQAQVALAPKREERVIRSIELGKGYRAVAGADK